MRAIGIFLTFLGALAAAGEALHIDFPTARWFFAASRKVPWLHTGQGGGGIFPWFGWLAVALLLLCGLTMILRSFTRGPRNPLTLRRIRRFREIKRGYWSLVILISLGGLAMLDQVVVGKRALAVQYKGAWSFPAFLPQDLKNKDFGVTGESPEAPVNYRKLRKILRESGEGRVILPPVPYDPAGDTLPPRSRPLVLREGIYHESGSRKPFFGLAAKFHDVDEARIHLRHTLRNGIISGPVDGWTPDGTPVYSAEFLNGKPVAERYNGMGTKEEFLNLETSALRALRYHPAPPMPEEGNWLGTTSQGYDVLAYLYVSSASPSA